MTTIKRVNLINFIHVQVYPALIAVCFDVGLFLYLEVVWVEVMDL